jgi:hypothetical protein
LHCCLARRSAEFRTNNAPSRLPASSCFAHFRRADLHAFGLSSDADAELAAEIFPRAKVEPLIVRSLYDGTTPEGHRREPYRWLDKCSVYETSVTRASEALKKPLSKACITPSVEHQVRLQDRRRTPTSPPCSTAGQHSLSAFGGCG